MDMKCMQFQVMDECLSATLDFTNPEEAIVIFVEEVNQIGSFMTTLGAKMVAKDMDENMARGVNALKCIGTSTLDNLANWVLSIYYLLK